MTGPPAGRVARALWASAIVLQAAAIPLTPHGGRGSGLVALTFVMLAFGTTGALLAGRLPRNPIGWLFLALGVSIATAGFTEAYGRRALETGGLPGGDAAAVFSNVLEGPALILALTCLLLLFPDGRLPSRRWRPAATATAVAGLLLAAGSALAPQQLNSIAIDNPIGLGGAPGRIASASTGVGYLLLMAIIAVSAISLVRRYRNATGILRQQLKWFGMAGAIIALAFVVAPVLWSIGTPWADAAWLALFLVAVITLPVATVVAVLRHRLYEIDVIVRRTLVYASLVAALALVYLAGIAGIGTLLRTVAGQSSALAVTISTLAVAAVFQPLRGRIQRAVDHRFYRSRYDVEQALGAFSARLRQEIDLDALSSEVVSVVAETVQPTRVSLWLRTVTIPERRAGTTEVS